MPSSIWCEKGNVPIHLQTIFTYEEIAKTDQNIFGNHDEEIKQILKINSMYSGRTDKLTRAPNYLIIPDERGFCPFYNQEDDICLLLDERPQRC